MVEPTLVKIGEKTYSVTPVPSPTVNPEKEGSLERALRRLSSATTDCAESLEEFDKEIAVAQREERRIIFDDQRKFRASPGKPKKPTILPRKNLPYQRRTY